MQESRIKNTSKNMITGVFNQCIGLIFNFVSRTVFIHYLGIEYLGISGLFSNILQVLSIADLGFGTAMVFSMYKPIAQDDKRQLAALMNFYKRVYNIIAVAVAAIGLSLVPLLPYIVNTEAEIDHLTLYYLLYLANTVASYMYAYKTSITIAQQKSYILNNYDSILNVIQNLALIAVIILTKNFLAYLSLQILCSFLRNFYKAKKSEKLYPYINDKYELDKKEKKNIFNNVKSMFIYKIGGVVLNNTDNIIISIMLGTAVVGIYSNYFMVVGMITTMLNIFFGSMSASIGNLNATSDSNLQYVYFKRINFLSVWIFSFCGICVYNLIDDFIFLWLGQDFILSKLTVMAIVLNLIMPGYMRTVSLYRDTLGMFKDTKYVFFITSILNCIFSVLLGLKLGLAGIILATALSRLLTNMWYEPYYLFKNYLKQSPLKYFSKQIIYIVIFLLINAAVSFSLMHIFGDKVTFLTLILKGIFCVIVPNLLMLVVYGRTDEFKYFLKLATGMIKKFLKK